MFPSHVGFPIERYHAVSRTDSDLGAIISSLQPAERVWVCYRDVDVARTQMQALVDLADNNWNRSPDQFRCQGYVLFEMMRTR